MLDVRRMQILRAVVTSGSITAAATHLGYTPSAISQQIAALEKEAATPLLQRVGRGIRPTAAGLLLAEHAEIVGQRLAEAETALADLRAGRTGHLTLRYFATAGADLVAPALARFRHHHPGIRVDLALADPDDPLADLAHARADLALAVNPTPRDSIRLVPLLDDPYRAVLPHGHPLLAAHPGPEPLNLADLAGTPWIGAETPGNICHRILLDACAAAGFTPDLALTAEDYATAQGFAAAGLGIALVPRLALGPGNRHPGVTVRPLRGPEPVRAIHAAVRDRAPSIPETALLDALRTVARLGDGAGRL